jgi:hypothetical protein
MVLEVEIPLDEDGFLDRQCSSPICGRYFKVLHADWEAANVNAATCPFCGFIDEPGNFTTVEQRDFLQQTAMAFAQQQLQEMLSGFAKSVNRGQSRDSLLSINVTTKFSEIPVPVTPDALASMRLQIQCDQCNATYAVVGAGFFCPLCGKNSARHTFGQAIAKARNAVEVAREIGERTDRDAAAEARRDALENQINNLVTAFQRFGEAAYVDLPRYSAPAKRNLFQRLLDASKEWSQAGGRPFESMLSSSEWNELLKYFQQRHLLSHQDGFVDAEYIAKSGDTTYQAGQRLILTEAQVLRMAELVEKLGGEMQTDLPPAQVGLSKTAVVAVRPIFPPKLPGVTDEDWRVYRIVCDAAVHEDHDLLNGRMIWQEASNQGLSEEQFGESVEILESKSLLDAEYVLDSSRVPYAIKLTHRGLEMFFSHTMAEYQAERKYVASALLEGESSSDRVVAKTGLSLLFVHHALKDFERRRWVADVFWTGGFGIVTIGSGTHLRRFVSS